MLSEENVMEILEAYDLTGSLRATAALCGVDHHTVRRYVAARAAGLDPVAVLGRPKVSDPYLAKIEEWVEHSEGKVRADVVHRKLCAMGYLATERTTRRVVASVKDAYGRSTHRVYKPWVTEPGLWLQFDYGQGPVVGGVEGVLFCAWLAWSRFRVILALPDRTMPSVIAALDRTLRAVGGAPTYLLTDNEKTVTTNHVAGLAVRNRTMLSVAHYYGVSLHTCVPADPESKGGSESTVKLAKADVLPRPDNLVEHYRDFAALEQACAEATERFNHRVHTMTGERPVDRLEREREHLHAIRRRPTRWPSGRPGPSRGPRWSPITVPGTRCRTPWPDGWCSPGETPTTWSSWPSTPRVPKKWPGTGPAPQVTSSSTTATTPLVARPPNVPRGRPTPGRRPSWPWARGRGATWRKWPPTGSAASPPAWTRHWRSRARTMAASSTRRSASVRSRGASRPVISPRS